MMYKVFWKRLSDGALIPAGEYKTKEAALAEARELPFLGLNEPVEVIVSDENGSVVFSTASDDS